MISRTFALALATLGSVVSASAVQLVTNGDFETGTGDGWTVDSLDGYPPDEIFDDWQARGYEDASATKTAFLGYADDNIDTITQSINTAGIGTATLSFDLKSDGWDGPGFDFLTVKLGGTVIGTIDLGAGEIEEFDQFSLHPTYDISGLMDGTKKDLSISVALDSSAETWAWVDNVSIEAQPVPEPATMAVLGFGALAVVRRRRRRR